MTDEIEIRHLRYFLEVATKLHFTRAAEALGIAQPALSQQIRRLEGLIGHDLFERTTRGVRLTPAGIELQHRAQATLAKLSQDVHRTRRVGSGEEGSLTIGFSGSAIYTRFAQAIARFGRMYPNVHVQLREMWTAQQEVALAEGTIDLGLMRDGRPLEGCTVNTLLEEHYMVALPAKHPLAAKKRLRVADLAREPFILFSPTMGSLAFARTVAVCEHEGFRPQIAQEAPQWSTVLRLVGVGLGVTIAPTCLKNMSVAGTVYREIASPARTTLDAAWRSDDLQAPAANFLAVLKKLVAK